jgi:hypothetical protein
MSVIRSILSSILVLAMPAMTAPADSDDDSPSTRAGLRVAHLDCGRSWRGGQNQALLLMRALARRGVHNTLIAPRAPLLERAAAEGIAVIPWRARPVWPVWRRGPPGRCGHRAPTSPTVTTRDLMRSGCPPRG